MDGSSTVPGFREMWPTGDCHYGNEHHIQHHQQHLQTQQTSNFGGHAASCNGGYQGQVTAIAPYSGNDGSSLGALLSDAIGKITPQVEVALEELLR